jgi:replicative DNA helicase
MKRLSPVLQPNDFYGKANAVIYEACCAIYNSGDVVDSVRLATYLRDHGKLSGVGGMAGLTDVLNSAPNTANLLSYARAVKDTARLRKLLITCERVFISGKGAHGDHLEFIAKARAELMEATRIAQYDTQASNKDLLAEIFRRMQLAVKDECIGIRTGIGLFDKLTLGLQDSQLIVVAARPGGAKSSWCGQIAMEAAKAGIGVKVFSLEMTKEEYAIRHISYLSGVDSQLIVLGKLSAAQWSKVTEAMNLYSQLPIDINDRSDLTINNIREITLGAIDKGFLEKKPVGLIVVDYIQRVYIPTEKYRQRREQIGDVARGLKMLAKETGLPVVGAAQLRRIPDNRAERRPTMDDVRECGDIEQEADIIALLHRQDRHAVESCPAEIIVDKSRNGRTGIINVTWNPKTTSFSDMPDDFVTT